MIKISRDEIIQNSHTDTSIAVFYALIQKTLRSPIEDSGHLNEFQNKIAKLVYENIEIV